MVLQVIPDVQSGPEGRSPQQPNQRHQESENPQLRNEQLLRNDGGNEQGCEYQSLPEYFLYRNTTSERGSGSMHLDPNNRTYDPSQRTISGVPERTVFAVNERTLLLEDTGKALRKMADTYIITRNTGHELRRIADEIYFKLGRSECHPPDAVFIEEVQESRMRRKNS
eukprot:XP_001196119.1 PREDICTED: uncharacterized protein LOC756658 [Strongylocentrotus purpuratus]